MSSTRASSLDKLRSLDVFAVASDAMFTEDQPWLFRRQSGEVGHPRLAAPATHAG